MKKHFVIFQSPGTFVHEETERPIDSWDVEKAVEMAHDIAERHAARPFCFYFTTRERSENDLDSKVTKESGRYFLGGQLLTVKEVQAMNQKEAGKYDILLSNMDCNNWPRVVMNDNSWRIFQPLNKGDQVLDVKLRPQKKAA